MKTNIFQNSQELEIRLYEDLKQMLPMITADDCHSILNGNDDYKKSKEYKELTSNTFSKKVIENIVDKYRRISEGYVLNHTSSKLSDLDLEMIKSVPQGGNWKDIPQATINKSKRLLRITQTGGRTTLYGRIDYSKPSYTITTYFKRYTDHPIYC